MKNLNLMIVIGTRPQYIKVAPLIRSLKLNKYKNIKYTLIDTGQHYDKNLSDNFYKELRIKKANYNLKVGSHTHGKQTAKIMIKLENIVLNQIPDCIIVFGDTNSTLAASLISKKLHIPLAHIEAGLRSYNLTMPEEINRILTDKISDYLFCPTKSSVLNLKKEGINKNIFNVGDIMYDNYLFYKKFFKSKVKYDKPYILVTIHRAENTDNNKSLENIIFILNKLSSDYLIIFAIHPRTKKILQKNNISTTGLKLIEPQSYINIIGLILNSKILITDSGGLQKEAYFAKIPCVTIRRQTEWIETLESGWNRLSNVNSIKNLTKKIQEAISFNRNNKIKSHYGNGKTSEKILDCIVKSL